MELERLGAVGYARGTVEIIDRVPEAGWRVAMNALRAQGRAIQLRRARQLARGDHTCGPCCKVRQDEDRHGA